MTTIRVTREELCEQVWTTPMSRLALQYGISDVALATTGRRMNVPRGHLENGIVVASAAGPGRLLRGPRRGWPARD